MTRRTTGTELRHHTFTIHRPIVHTQDGPDGERWSTTGCVRMYFVPTMDSGNPNARRPSQDGLGFLFILIFLLRSVTSVRFVIIVIIIDMHMDIITLCTEYYIKLTIHFSFSATCLYCLYLLYYNIN